MFVFLTSVSLWAASQDSDSSEVDATLEVEVSSDQNAESEDNTPKEKTEEEPQQEAVEEICDDACVQRRLMKLKDNWKKVPEEVHLEQIVELQRSGRFDSAEERLGFLVEEYGTLEYRYLFVVNEELQEHRLDALAERRQ